MGLNLDKKNLKEGEVRVILVNYKKKNVAVMSMGIFISCCSSGTQKSSKFHCFHNIIKRMALCIFAFITPVSCSPLRHYCPIEISL
jgi:hypothetical protein